MKFCFDHSKNIVTIRCDTNFWKYIEVDDPEAAIEIDEEAQTVTFPKGVQIITKTKETDNQVPPAKAGGL